MFWHLENSHGDRSTCVNSTVSGFAVSPDGFTWTPSPIQPYVTEVVLTSGEVVTVSTRERPKLLFDAEVSGAAWVRGRLAPIERRSWRWRWLLRCRVAVQGRITHLVNGVCSAPACPDWPPTGCEDCKFYAWDYTLIQPLAT